MSNPIKHLYSFLYAHQDNKHNIEAVNKMIDSLTALVNENKHRAEVINKRDGTIKQLQKRIRKLEKENKRKMK